MFRLGPPQRESQERRIEVCSLAGLCKFRQRNLSITVATMRRSSVFAAVFMMLTYAAAVPSDTIHTVVPTECTRYFTWQVLGMYFSYQRTGQSGPLTRILCCTDEQYSILSLEELTLVPTHIAPSYSEHPRLDDSYTAYNKPVAVIDWLAKTDVKEEYILVIDTDIIMRRPFVLKVICPSI